MTNDVATGEGDGRRTGFYDRPVRGLSVTVCIIGGLCLILGIAVLAVALTAECTFKEQSWDYGYSQTRPPPTYELRRCRYDITYVSPGIWSGVMYLASGIIGILAARRKTTCLIVSMLVLSLVATPVAICGVMFAIVPNFVDKQWNQVNPYPVFLIFANSVIALSGVIVFILSWIKFGYSCRALCCNGDQSCFGQRTYQPNYQYQPYYSQPIMLTATPGQTNYVAQPSYPSMVYPQASTAPPSYASQGQVVPMAPYNQTATGMQPVASTPPTKA